MKKKFIRRVLALAAAAGLCLACAAPVFAEETISSLWLQGYEDGERKISLSGPDASSKGVRLENGKRYSFTAEQTELVTWNQDDVITAVGAEFYSKFRSDLNYDVETTDIVLLWDGETMMLGKLQPGSAITTRVTFDDAEAEIQFSTSHPSDTWKVHMTGQAEMEVRCTLQAVVEVTPPEDGVKVQEGKEYVKNSMSFWGMLLDVREEMDALPAQPQEVVLHVTASGRFLLGNYTTDEKYAQESNVNKSTQFFYSKGDAENYLWDQSYSVSKISLDYGGVSIPQEVLAFHQYVFSMRFGAFESDVGGGSAARTAATTAGAAALGLGGGAVLNGLSSVLENTPFAKRREDFEDPDAPDDTPDLPEEDTPSVSVSFYRPFDDMVNTKGAAVDIQLTVNGGEGLHWNYLPTAICPEGLKAVIPAVVGSSNTATLVLSLTGAAMKKPHVPVFITVVAWAIADDGQLLKTTGTMELQLHRPGLEAERRADGTLKVTLYTDGNLDGVAEKVTLKPEQYTCTQEADGALTIRAKKPYKGSCRLEVPAGE